MDEHLFSKILDELKDLKSKIAEVESMIILLQEESVQKCHDKTIKEQEEEAEEAIEINNGNEEVVDFNNDNEESIDLDDEEPIDINLDISEFTTTNIYERKNYLGENSHYDDAEVGQKAKTTIIDLMQQKRAWKKDIPGSKVKNIISAISLNDRVLFTKKLFNGDSNIFSDTIDKLNEMEFLLDAEKYIDENFKAWDMDSDIVYRFMMILRRKLR